MKNIININTSGEQLISSVDDGTNTLFINGNAIASSNWVGTGNYTATIEGHNITIAKVADLTGNVIINKVSDYNYALNKVSAMPPGLLDSLFPVGAEYMTSANDNPAAWLGGTWQLVDKQFKQQVISNILDINDTNVTSVSSAYAMLEGHIAHIRLAFTNKVALADSSVSIGTLKLTSFGMNQSGNNVYSVYPVGYSDGGNGVFLASLVNTGAVSILDVVTKTSGGSIAAGSSCFIDCLMSAGVMSAMLDSFCDKFIWERTE